MEQTSAQFVLILVHASRHVLGGVSCFPGARSSKGAQISGLEVASMYWASCSTGLEFYFVRGLFSFLNFVHLATMAGAFTIYVKVPSAERYIWFWL